VTEFWRAFFALGDPNRLTMVRRLSESGPLSMVRLIEGMPFSRQAGAKHVGVLRSAGLISIGRQGREQLVSLERDNFHLSQMFMKQMEEGWDARLERLEGQLNFGPSSSHEPDRQGHG
jgi:DNA-binding transcriptional ArsR family regulator